MAASGKNGRIAKKSKPEKVGSKELEPKGLESKGLEPKKSPGSDETELEVDLGAGDDQVPSITTVAVSAVDEIGADDEPVANAPRHALVAGPTLDDVRASEIESQFGFHEEESIVSLALDMPELFATMTHLIKPEYFARLETRYVVAWILNLNEKYQVIPTREILKDHLLRQLTTDDPYESILKIVERKSNPREVPLIKERLKDWARVRAYGLLYSEETVLAYQRGDLGRLESIFADAARISDIGYRGFWLYDQVEELLDPTNVIHMKTGWPSLDRVLNNGGPSPGEVLIWLAATNVGKCHTLDSKVFEEHLSRIYELEMDDGTVIKLVGADEIQTTRGIVKVCDLSEDDDIISLPPLGHSRYENVPSLWVCDGIASELPDDTPARRA